MPSQPASNVTQAFAQADPDDAPAVPLTTLIAHLGSHPPPELTELWCQQLAELEVTLKTHDWPLCQLSLDDLWVAPNGQLRWPALPERISSSLAEKQSTAEHPQQIANSPHDQNQPPNSWQPLQHHLKALAVAPTQTTSHRGPATDATGKGHQPAFPQVALAPHAHQHAPADDDAPHAHTKTAKRSAHQPDTRRKRIATLTAATLTAACLIALVTQMLRGPQESAQTARLDSDSPRTNFGAKNSGAPPVPDPEPLVSLSPSPSLSPATLETAETPADSLESAADLQPDDPATEAGALAPLDLPLPQFDWNAQHNPPGETPSEPGEMRSASANTLPSAEPTPDGLRPPKPPEQPAPLAPASNGMTDGSPEFWKVDAEHGDVMADRAPAPAPAEQPVAESRVSLRFNQRREQAILSPPEQSTAETWRWQVTFTTQPDDAHQPAEDDNADPPEQRNRDDLRPLTMRWLIAPSSEPQRVDRGLLEIGHEGESPVRVRIRFDVRSRDTVRSRDAAEIRWLSAATLQPELGYRPITHDLAGEWLAAALAHRVRTLQMLQMTQIAYQNRANPEPVRDALRDRRDQLEELADLADLWLERATELDELMRQIERELVIELAPASQP